MTDINQLFFELIRVAIGTQVTLSRPPSKAEWAELYAMSKKQSLLGICFAAVQKLQCNDNQELRTQNPQSKPTHNQEPKTKNLDEVQYLTWMGMAAKIQQRNAVVTEQVRQVYQKLQEDGMRSCILKGQSHQRFYPQALQGLRQSGDIDVMVDGNDVDVLRYARQYEGDSMEWHYKHVHWHLLEDTSIDIHYRIATSRNLWRNSRIQRWCEDVKKDGIVYDEALGYAVLKDEENVVFLLCHALWHFLFEGVGLRQVMDIYFVLLSTMDSDGFNVSRIQSVLKSFDMLKFASAVMFVMKEVFWLPEQCMVCEPNEKEGRFLIEEVMQTGNFGHYDERKTVTAGDKGLVRACKKSVHYTRLLRHYPSEFLWTPIGSVYLRLWHWKTKRNLA